jgi:predicted RNA binding protein YcfA (HicA-like mRNA interferase family)
MAPLCSGSQNIGLFVMDCNRRKIIARLEREGWFNVDGTKHDKFRHPSKSGAIYVPRHNELKKFVARSIARSAGWKDM